MSSGDSRHDRTPLIEISVAHEHGPIPRRPPTREAVEIWTANHVYVVDSSMQCIAVRTPSGAEPVPDSTFRGARLVGGQRSEQGEVELSYPFPRPGSQAVFETRQGKISKFHHTTTVNRVVVRVSIMTVTASRAAPTWEQISAATRDYD